MPNAIARHVPTQINGIVGKYITKLNEGDPYETFHQLKIKTDLDKWDPDRWIR